MNKKTKNCSKCEKILPNSSEYFYKDGRGGLRAECKQCNKKTYRKAKDYIEKVKSGLVDLTPHDWKKERVDFIDLDDIDSYIETIEFAESIGYDEVFFKTDKKCVIPWLADFHVGNIHTDHKYLSQIIRICSETDNVFPILGGDYCDNYTVGGRMYGGVHEQVIPLPKQKNMVKIWVESLDEKLIGVIQGCHDEWMYNTNEFDFSQYLASHSKTGKPLGFESFIDLKVGDIEYRLLARHRYPKWSSTNQCNGLLQYIREHKHDVDVIFGAHRHLPSTSEAYIDGKLVLALRTSAFKITDRWQAHRGYQKSPLILPTIVLDNETKKIIQFRYFEDAIKYLKNN